MSAKLPPGRLLLKLLGSSYGKRDESVALEWTPAGPSLPELHLPEHE